MDIGWALIFVCGVAALLSGSRTFYGFSYSGVDSLCASAKKPSSSNTPRVAGWLSFGEPLLICATGGFAIL